MNIMLDYGTRGYLLNFDPKWNFEKFHCIKEYLRVTLLLNFRK